MRSGYSILSAYENIEYPALHHEKRILDIFVGGKYRDEVEILEHEAEVLSAELRGFASAKGGDVGVEHGQFAAGGMVQTADHVEQRGLAAAGRTDERHEGRPLNRKVHPLDGLHLNVAGSIGFDQIVRVDQTHLETLYLPLVNWLTATVSLPTYGNNVQAT